jgi:hypothetical protein
MAHDRDEHDDRSDRGSLAEDPDGRRDDPVYGPHSPNEVGGDQIPPLETTHKGPPRDPESSEPLGPMTPDPGRPLRDTAEAHDEITPHDLPKGHPGRKEAERPADRNPSGATRGNR